MLDAVLSSIVTELDWLDVACTNISDMIVAVHSIEAMPNTFRDLARKLLHTIHVLRQSM